MESKGRNMIDLNKITEQNNHILKTYTRDKGYVNIMIQQMDHNGKVINVFKNRYQAARYILDNDLTTYKHIKGIGYTRACIAGSLTNSIKICNSVAYGYVWKLISPKAKKPRVTKTYVNDRVYIEGWNVYNRWNVLTGTKAIPFNSKHDICNEYRWGRRELDKIIKHNLIVDGKSVIPHSRFPKPKEFKSFNEMSKFFRIRKEKAKKILKNKAVVMNYIPHIDNNVIQNNFKKIQNFDHKNKRASRF
jgi:hypothetical protein